MEYYLGEIILFAGNFAPRGTALCQGQIISIAQNTALFSLLGTSYGGNGQTTFALPNLAGRVPVGTGQSTTGSSYEIGQSAGTETVTLTTLQMPAHTHVATATVTIPAVIDDGNSNQPGPDSILAIAPANSNIYSNAPADTNLKPFSVPVTNSIAGGSQPFSVMQPYLAISYCIVTAGVFPSRN